MVNFIYDHDAACFSDGLGIDDATDKRCREIIFFSCVSNWLIANEFYGSFDDAPRKLNTKTGDVEKCLSLVTNVMEKDYLLIIFEKFHQISLSTIAHYKLMTECDEKQKTKMQILFQLAKLKAQEEKDGELINPEHFFKKIEEVKKSNYNFEVYMRNVEQIEEHA